MMLPKAIVLGARHGSGNIGDRIAEDLYLNSNWEVVGDHCQQPNGTYAVPDSLTLSQYDAMVVTLGYTALTPILGTTEEEISDIIYACLVLPMLAVRNYAVARRDLGGKIVLTGSYANDHVLTGCSAYCAAKAGLDHAVRSLAWELPGTFSIHIVHPYHVPETPMGKAVVEGMIENRGMTREEAEAYQAKDLKYPEHLSTSDIAGVVRWLLDSPEADWLSGQGVRLYGGVR